MPNLTVCGRYRRGRIRGRKLIPAYRTPGICAIFPRGRRKALPDPPEDGLYEACSQMDLGSEWKRTTVVRWNFRPTR